MRSHRSAIRAATKSAGPMLGLSIASALLTGGAGAQAPAPALKPIVPVAASTLAKDPKPFFGEVVSVTAAVERTSHVARDTV